MVTALPRTGGSKAARSVLTSIGASDRIAGPTTARTGPAGFGSPPPAAGVVRSTRVPAAGIGVFIPPGVAHGFAALTDLTLTYLVDQYYNPADELGVAWDDPDIGVDWRLDGPVVSERDRANPRRRDLPIEQIPHFSLRT